MACKSFKEAANSVETGEMAINEPMHDKRNNELLHNSECASKPITKDEPDDILFILHTSNSAKIKQCQ